MKIKYLFPFFLIFLMFSCTTKGHKPNWNNQSRLTLAEEDSDTGSTSPNGAERITVAYKGPGLKMYSFSEKQKKKLFGTGSDYMYRSICVNINIPSDLDLSSCRDEEYPVSFYLYTQKQGKNILDSKTYSTVKIPATFIGQTVRIGVCLPKVPSGFAIDAPAEVTISDMAVESRCIGWNFSGGVLKYNFGPSGGTVYTNLYEVDFSDGKYYFDSGIDTEICMIYTNMDPDRRQGKIDLNIGGENFRVRYNQGQRRTLLSCGAIEKPFSIFSVDNLYDVCGIVMEDSDLDKEIPITLDPGFIVDWDIKNWRNSEYEIFSWEQFPNILIFDTVNYQVQDKIFKRLAFFAEKDGYVGTLATDKMIANQHGFNALDFRTSVIANFFNQATKEKFKLNKYELFLKKIMIQNGLLYEESNGKVSPGEGAIVSISRELPEYLRWQFLRHECFHGIYFTHKDFQNEVGRLYRALNPRAKDFIKLYFTLSPELSYDIYDEELIQNEVMAYTLQNSLDNVGKYFSEIANRKIIRENEPMIAEYIKTTNARDFVEIANVLDRFVNTEYGLNTGRVYLVTKLSNKKRQ